MWSVHYSRTDKSKSNCQRGDFHFILAALDPLKAITIRTSLKIEKCEHPVRCVHLFSSSRYGDKCSSITLVLFKVTLGNSVGVVSDEMIGS